jgi:hypothetical protein
MKTNIIQQIAVHGHVTPAIAEEALQLTLDMNATLELALLTVEDERARQRLRDCATSLLAGQINYLMRAKEDLQ